MQLARKDAGLRIEDTIALTLAVPAELRPLVERFREAIASETLASELVVVESGDLRETVRLDGHEVGIELKATGTIFTAS